MREKPVRQCDRSAGKGRGEIAVDRPLCAPRCGGKPHRLARAEYCRAADRQRCRKSRRRRGAATLDYALIMGVALPMAGIALWFGPRILRLVFEFTSSVIGWPFQ